MFGDEAELEVLDAEREIQLRVVRAHVELVAVLPLVDGSADGDVGGGGQLGADISVRGGDVTLVVGVGLGGAEQTVLAVRGDRVLAVLAFREGVVARFLRGVLVILERGDLRLDGVDVLFRQFDGHIAVAFEGEPRAYLHIQRFAVVDLDVEFAVQVLVDEVGKGDAADVERAQDIAHEIVADMEGEAAFADDQARHLVLHGSDVRLFALLVGGETFRLGGSARDDDGVEDGTVKQVAEIFVDEPADLVERRGYPRQSEEGQVEVDGHAAVIRAQPQHFGSGFVGQVVKLDVQLGLRQVVHVEHDVQVEPEVRRGVALGGLGHLDGHAADVSDDVFEESAEVKHAFGYAELELDRGAQADDGIVEGRERHRLFAVGSLARGDERRDDGALRVSADFDLYGAELEPEALGRAVSAQHRAHSEEERRVTGVKFDKDIKLIENVGQAAEVGHEGGDEQAEDGLGRHYLQTFGGKQRLQQRVAHRAVRGGIRLGGSRRFRLLLFPGLFGGVLKRFRHESGEAGHLSVVVGDAEDVGAVEIQVAVLDVDARHRLVVAFGDIAARGFIGGVGGELEVLVKFDELERYLEAGHALKQRDDEFLGVERAVFVLAGVEVDLRELGKIQTRGQAESKTRGHAVLYAEVDIEVVDVDGKQRAEQRIDRAAELVIRLAVRVEVDPAHYAELDGLGSRVGIGGGAVHESEDALDRGSDVGEGRARLFVDESANGAGESYVKTRAQSEIQRHAVLEHGADRELEQSPALVLRLQFEADGGVLGEQQFARGDLGADELTEHRRQHIRAEGDVRAQAAGEQIAAHARDGGAEGHALDDAVDQREHGVEHGRFCGRAVCAVRRHAFRGRGRLRDHVDEPHEVDADLGPVKSAEVEIELTVRKIDVDQPVVDGEFDIRLERREQRVERDLDRAGVQSAAVSLDRLREGLPFRGNKRAVDAVHEDVGLAFDGVRLVYLGVGEDALEVAGEDLVRKSVHRVELAALVIDGVDIRGGGAGEFQEGIVLGVVNHEVPRAEVFLGKFRADGRVAVEFFEVEERRDMYADVCGDPALRDHELQPERVEQRAEDLARVALQTRDAVLDGVDVEDHAEQIGQSEFAFAQPEGQREIDGGAHPGARRGI